MKEAQKFFKSRNEGQIEPFTFAKNDSKQHTLLSNTNKELGTEDNNINIKISKDLNSEGKRTNELADFSNKNTMKENNNKNLDVNDNNNNDEDVMGDYNYGQQDDDFYYFISENIPPQNFSEKLRNIKIKYEKLKNEIEKLKKENKKYNPNYVMKKDSHWND